MSSYSSWMALNTTPMPPSPMTARRRYSRSMSPGFRNPPMVAPFSCASVPAAVAEIPEHDRRDDAERHRAEHDREHELSELAPAVGRRRQVAGQLRDRRLGASAEPRLGLGAE